MGRGGGVVGLTENKATQPSLAGAWAELGKRLTDKQVDPKLWQQNDRSTVRAKSSEVLYLRFLKRMMD